MIIKYSIENIKEYYLNNNIFEDITNIENIISNKIEYNNINSEILHIFPITISLSVTLLLASYILLY